MKPKTILFLSVISLIAISYAFALPNPYSLSGRVYDNIGNPVEGAEIVLTNQRTEGQLYVKTNVYGEYQEDAYNFAGTYKDGDIIHYYARYKGYKIEKTTVVDISKGGTKLNFVFPFCLGFVTGKGSYPSIAGTHKGTIMPTTNINVTTIEICSCVGTGGHIEYAKILGNGVSSQAVWNGYTSNYRILEFDMPFTLEKGKTYNYTIKTGSYPQIIHTDRLEVPAGVITCTEFVDANGKIYDDWIPAIRLK